MKDKEEGKKSIRERRLSKISNVRREMLSKKRNYMIREKCQVKLNSGVRCKTNLHLTVRLSP